MLHLIEITKMNRNPTETNKLIEEDYNEICEQIRNTDNF